MKFLILSNNYNEASTRYRYIYYEKYFKEKNHIFDYCPFLYEDYFKDKYKFKKNKLFIFFKQFKRTLWRYAHLKKNIKNYDVVVIAKEVFPYFPYFIEKRLLKNVKFILDFDDYPKRYTKNIVFKKYCGDKIEKLAKLSLFNSVGNMWYFEKFNQGKNYYLPTVIDITKYRVKNDFADDKINIVWIGGPSTSRYLEIIKEPIKILQTKYNINLKIIGGVFNDSKINYEVIEWSEKTEAEEILKCDIGIMPLYDSLFEKGKCGFKLIQYMAAGLPVVASPAPANEEIIIHGENGFIAKDSKEWVKFLEKLILEKKIRIEMGIKNRKRIEQKYSYQTWADRFMERIKAEFI